MLADQRMSVALPSTEHLLVIGGDARIALDQSGRFNQYGCQPLLDRHLVALGSSTASVISEAGFAAADRLRTRIQTSLRRTNASAVYALELERIRQELLRLCEIPAAAVEVVFGASGTDMHLIASQLLCASSAQPLRIIMVESTESGSGVPAALAGRHFNSCAPFRSQVATGELIGQRQNIEIATVPVRHSDGSLRAPDSVDAEVETLAATAVAQGQRVLLVLTDVSKTGCIAPSPACALRLRARWHNTIDVLIDACQFRLAPATLQAYLQCEFMVALTGSKFVGGPSFSGALLLPAARAYEFMQRPLPQALRAYSARADWPLAWNTTGALDDVVNFGLLLRWEAALEELRAFRAVPESAITHFLQTFERAVQGRLLADACFEPLSVPALERRPLLDSLHWDHIQTIHPFILYRTQAGGERIALNRYETAQVHQALQVSEPADIGALRYQLGQPVACGQRGGVPVSALRLCASARLVVEAVGGDRNNTAAVCARALAALDRVARLVQR